MKKVVSLPSFERTVKKLTLYEKKQLAKGLESLNSFLHSGQSTYGFRYKKIDYDKYEFRIDIKLRVVIKVEKDTVYLVLVGTHEEVKRYLMGVR